MPTDPKPRLPGFPCPECGSHRMLVYATRSPKRDFIVRYRKCAKCGTHVVTEERVSTTRKPRAAAEQQAAPVPLANAPEPPA